MANNNVTAGSIKTPILSANQIMIDGKPISEYIQEKTTSLEDNTIFKVFARENNISGRISLEKALEENQELSKDDSFIQLSANSFQQYYDKKIQYEEDIISCKTIGIEFYSIKSKEENDMIIDWGDNTITTIKNEQVIDKSDIPTYTKEGGKTYHNIDNFSGLINYEAKGEGKTYFPMIVHTYKNEGKYTVKIYGHDYFMIRFGLTDAATETGIVLEDPSKYDIVFEIFNNECKLATCVKNISSALANNKCIQRVKVNNVQLDNITNSVNVFANCVNLIEYVGSTQNTFLSHRSIQCHNMFYECKHLKTCQGFYYPTDVWYSTSGYVAMFAGCESLEADVLTLLPKYGFSQRYIGVQSMFKNCKKITCSDYKKLANILWNDTSKIIQSCRTCFTGCTGLDLSKIPTEFGGTATNIINKDTNTTFLKGVSQAQYALNTIKYTGTGKTRQAPCMNFAMNTLDTYAKGYSFELMFPEYDNYAREFKLLVTKGGTIVFPTDISFIFDSSLDWSDVEYTGITSLYTLFEVEKNKFYISKQEIKNK